MGFFSKDIKTMNDLFMHGLEISFTPKTRSRSRCPT